jgi:hypothetical protein
MDDIETVAASKRPPQSASSKIVEMLAYPDIKDISAILVRC